MSFINGYLNKTAKLYTIDTSTTTTAGQPVETLILSKTIKVFFSSNPRRVFQLFNAGQIKAGEFVAISAVETKVNQVLEVDGIKYKISAANPAQLKNRIFAYINYMGYYQH
jgi:hypothetical protein